MNTRHVAVRHPLLLVELPAVNRCKCAAFTLVELLVVIAIIGMLAGLLLPAVQNARKRGRQTVCLNNMSQFAKALQTYDSRRNQLPGYANIVGKSSSTSTAHRLGSWIVSILPDIGRQNEYDTWKTDPATDGDDSDPLNLSKPFRGYIELLVCPENVPDTPGSPAVSYVANCGIQDTITPTSLSPPASYTPNDKTANGVFFNRYYPTDDWKKVFSPPATTLGKIPDGESNTLMLSENVQAGFYSSGGPVGTAPQFKYDKTLYNVADAERYTGFVWNKSLSTTNPLDQQRINFKIDDTNTTSITYARPSSRHGGGVNVAMCGGELFFMRDDIDYEVYEQLMTSEGKKSDMTNGGRLVGDDEYK